MEVPLFSSFDSQMELEQVSILKHDHDHEDSKSTKVSGACGGFHSSQFLSSELICKFSRNEHNELVESKERNRTIRRLCTLIFLYLLVMSVQIYGGIRANSLAVITDAAHLLTDVAGFLVSLFVIWVSSREADSHNSFGFKRLEVLGALLSVQLIWLISSILIYEAFERLFNKTSDVDGEIMFVISAFGFFINSIIILWLGHDHHNHHHHHHHHHNRTKCGQKDYFHEEHDANRHDEESDCVPGRSGGTSRMMNINLQGAYLHVIADMIQTIGVMIGGAVIWAKPSWLVVDLICTFVFSAFAMTATLPMLKNILGILTERVPSEIDIQKLERNLKCINGVQSVHELHVWEITLGRTVLTCHVVADPGVSHEQILSDITDLSAKVYGIHNVTIQVESE